MLIIKYTAVEREKSLTGLRDDGKLMVQEAETGLPVDRKTGLHPKIATYWQLAGTLGVSGLIAKYLYGLKSETYMYPRLDIQVCDTVTVQIIAHTEL